MRIIYLHRTDQSNDRFLSNFICSLENQVVSNISDFKILLLVKGPNKYSFNIHNYINSICSYNIENILYLPDDGFDLGAYFRACKNLSDEMTLFLNSYSRFSDPLSLHRIYKYVRSVPNDCLLGCTGSLGTLSTRKKYINIKSLIFLPIIIYWNYFSYRNFPKMPNPHIRTTGFICSSKKYYHYIVSKGFPLTKEDCYSIESGNKSLTNYFKNKYLISKNGMFNFNKIVIGGFRHEKQQNLLISDNHTDIYDNACLLKQKILTYRSFG